MSEKKDKVDNLYIYNAVRQPPKEAVKEIQAGRLKGMSDINPMWRLKALTEQFGVCGVGWKYTITKQWLEVGPKEEQSAFVNVDLFIKVDGVWSDAIPGTGGSSFIALERNGLHMSDECFKMALTDAISVSCKALGFAADIYFSKDRTKYDQQTEKASKTDTPEEHAEVERISNAPISEIKQKTISDLAVKCKVDISQIFAFCKVKSIGEITEKQYPLVINEFNATLKKLEEKNKKNNDII